MDLAMFLDDGEDDELDGRRREELGEEIYAQVVKSERERYAGDGVMIMTDGGRNNFLGALLQCFMVIEPLRSFYLGDGHNRIGETAPDVKRRLLSEELAKTYRETF